MAVKARAEITLTSIRDVQSATRYYLLQSSTSTVPSKPTTNPPGGDWVTSEPTYTSGSTNSLYFTDCTVFSDDTFVYSDVSLSSSYEAAKVAYNKAENAESIAEKATHSINLIPFGSRSLDDAAYWVNGYGRDGWTSTDGVIYYAEQLENGWLHLTVDATSYTGAAAYKDDYVQVIACPSVKKGGLYTFLYEIRNNQSTYLTQGANSYFYIQQNNNNQFWGSETEEILESPGVNETTMFMFNWATDPNVTYVKRFTKYTDDGTHAGANPKHLFRINHRIGKGDYIDYEVRISLYEGRYLGDYMPYVVSDTTDLNAAINAANTLAQSAKDTADGKITTFYAASTATPTATTTGDLWIKTDDGNSLWRWNGTDWISVDNADIQSALTAAGTAQATADSKVVTFAQASTPTATDVGDVWIDTDDNNHLHRWDGEDWVDIHDPQIDAANEKIDNLEVGGRNLIINTLYPSTTAAKRPRLIGQIANTGGRGTASVAEHGVKFTTTSASWQYIYFGASSNSAAVDMLGLEPGETYTLSADLSWKILSSAKGKADATTCYMGATLHYSTVESGSFSVLNSINQFPITQADKGTAMSGRLVYTFTVPTTAKRLYLGIKCSLTTASHYAKGDYIEARNLKLEKGSKASAWTPAPEDLEEAITASQETADGKNTVYYQADAPSGGTYKTNDIWFDTDDENKMYHWNGSAWTAAPFGNAAFSNIDAGKVTTGTMSAARIKGDILTLGGANNVDGMLKVYDANGTLVGSFTREGLMAIAGTIGGWTIGATQLYNTYLEDNAIQHSAAFSPTDELQFSVSDNGTGTTMLGVHDRTATYGSNGINFAVRTLDDEWYQSYVAPRGDDYGVRIGPALDVYGPLSSSSMKSSSLELQTNMGSYVRQPAMIMSGVATISTGTSEKNLTLCTVPTEYQSGYRIVPFVSRRYGSASGTPSDTGDFYYAYYNSVTHNVHIKLANKLPSDVIFQFDYMIYAVPES